MLNKTTIAVAAALILGTASVALAAGENAQGGFDNLGSNGKSVDSPRPGVQSPMLQPVSPEERIRTEGRGSAEGLREQKEEGRKDPQEYPGTETK
jgi:hypothetical protein